MWTEKGDLKGPFEKYYSVLQRYGCTDENIVKLQAMWNEPHRVYHNQEHLEEILSLIEGTTHGTPSVLEDDIMYLTAFFHDAVYDPKSKTNEEDSIEVFVKFCPKAKDIKLNINGSLQPVKDYVCKNIFDTKDHTATPSSSYSKKFLAFDLHGMMNGTIARMISDEKKIMREFGFVDFDLYRRVRGEKFLEKFVPFIKGINPSSQVDAYYEWYKSNTPKIAVFAGTFYPFHKGHLDVLRKAEKMFDKVIVLSLVNPNKSNNLSDVGDYIEYELSALLPNNQVEFTTLMLHQYIKTLKYPVTVVKGLRNASDFDSEKLQLRYMEDMYPEINIVYIVSDRKYEHVSSTGVKSIQGFGATEEANQYLI